MKFRKKIPQEGELWKLRLHHFLYAGEQDRMRTIGPRTIWSNGEINFLLILNPTECPEGFRGYRCENGVWWHNENNDYVNRNMYRVVWFLYDGKLLWSYLDHFLLNTQLVDIEREKPRP